MDAEQQAAETQSDESSETQTTLTTRVRINIPGSRPIPPVVMRTPMNDGDKPGTGSRDAGTRDAGAPQGSGTSGGSGPGGAAGAGSAGRGEASGGGEGGAGAGAADEPAAEKTSDWFAPRKSPAPTPARGTGVGSGGPGGAAGGFGAGAAAQAQGQGSGSGSGNGPYGPGAGPRPTAGPDTGAPGVGGPGQGGPGLGSGGPGNGGPGSGGPGVGVPGSGALGVGGPGQPGPGAGGPGIGGPGAGGPGAEFDALHGGSLYGTGPGTGTGQPGPAGPTTGPATGEGPAFARGGPPAGGPPRMSDDTAQLTPQPPVPVPGPVARVSGDTLNSGIPVVPPGQGAFPPGPQDGPPAQRGASAPQPSASASAPASPAPKKKGRSKLMLAAVAVFVVTGGLYGAGLLMNHSDVPKGTTVLGVDIGGGTHDEAVKKLDAALGDRANQPIQLALDGKQVELTPAQAGLSLDDQATVRAAAVSDYNPVSVIGSLFGGERSVEPDMPTDEEKLADALERLVGGQGPSNDGGIKFEAGKAIPVYGKPGNQVNIQGAVAAVDAAYRTQVETGKAAPVELPVVAADPKVSKAEVDRMMKEFAEPAMSGLITVRTDTGQAIPFSPEKSIPKFVSVVADKDGKLTQKYDLEELRKLYGTTFDGVMVTKGDGTKKPLSVQEVAAAAGKALVGKTPEERIVTISTNPS
uniref:hypothetical protein n=1 Tax=Streptomyces apocyni TaxID=2654677 RepID=UPI0012E9D462|nr:hypothetical protein [Streptomyces apocyni]